LIVDTVRPAKERSTPSRDWLSKTLAGVTGGFGLGIAASGLLVFLTPVWIGVMSASFMFRSGLRAWAWLGGANIAGFAMLALARHFFTR
jgi:hypothetical protein